MINILYKDLKVISQTPLGMFKAALISHTFHMVLMIRVGQLVAKIPLAGSAMRIFVEYLIRILFASDISCKAEIGSGLAIMHGQDIVIGAYVKIGTNCKIFNGVTLGNRYTETSNSAQPKIDNNVVLGTGAKILGDIHLGDNAKVGANSVVLIDVPANRVAVGVPAKLI